MPVEIVPYECPTCKRGGLHQRIATCAGCEVTEYSPPGVADDAIWGGAWLPEGWFGFEGWFGRPTPTRKQAVVCGIYCAEKVLERFRGADD